MKGKGDMGELTKNLSKKIRYNCKWHMVSGNIAALLSYISIYQYIYNVLPHFLNKSPATCLFIAYSSH